MLGRWKERKFKMGSGNQGKEGDDPFFLRSPADRSLNVRSFCSSVGKTGKRANRGNLATPLARAVTACSLIDRPRLHQAAEKGIIQQFCRSLGTLRELQNSPHPRPRGGDPVY